jgi:hypothetical protein
MLEFTYLATTTLSLTRRRLILFFQNVSPQGKRQFSFERVLAAAHALIEQSALPLVGYTYEENIAYDATRDLDHRGGYHRSRRGTR